MVDATIHVIDRGRFEADQNLSLANQTVATHNNPNPDLTLAEKVIYNYVIDHPDGTILWDTGVHHDYGGDRYRESIESSHHPVTNPADHRLEDDLDKAGYTVNDIDAVIQSHLHFDHAGGLELFDGTDIPIFVHEEELKYAYFSTVVDDPIASAAYYQIDFNHDLRWEIIYDHEAEYFEDIKFVHMPGHTPGLLGTVIHLDTNQTLVFPSDTVYRKISYEEKIPLSTRFLWSQPHWFESLQYIEGLVRNHDAQIVFSHDPNQFDEIRDGWP